MTEKFYIAAYCRISVDDELNKENTSIENQKAIIDDYVKTNFPNSELDFYEDRDKSGYTFEQREGDLSQITLIPIDRFCVAIHSVVNRHNK